MRFFALAAAALASLVSAQTITTTTSSSSSTSVTTPGHPNAIFAPTVGTHVTAGGSFLIKWTPDSSITSVNIFLRKNNGNPNNSDNLGALATNIPNSGQYLWKVDDTLVAGSDYAIELTWGAQTVAEAQYSDPFTVDSTATATPSGSASTTATSPSSTVSSSGNSTMTSSGTMTTKTSTSTTTSSGSTASGSSTGAPSPGAGSALVSSPLALILSVIAALVYLQ